MNFTGAFVVVALLIIHHSTTASSSSSSSASDLQFVMAADRLPSSISYQPTNRQFLLSTNQSSWAFRINEETGQLQHLHWSRRIPDYGEPDYLSWLADEESEVVSFDAGPKNAQLLEWPDEGTGDFRIPAFRLRYVDDGYSVANFVYSSHRIIEAPTDSETLYKEWIPHCRTDGEKDGTLIVELVDPRKGIRVELSYTVLYDFDVITRGVRFINPTNSTVVLLEEVNSASIDFPPAPANQPYYLTQLVGSWGRERQVQSHRLSPGLSGIESRRGASSHQQNPFIILTKGKPNEDFGEAFGISLIWPSSFRSTVELTQTGTVRATMGIHPDSFRWQLNPESTFQAPESVHIYSSEGTGSLSRKLHSMIRHRLLPSSPNTQWQFDTPRPVLVNSWEAMYFNCSESAIWQQLVEPAYELGLDMVVLDDGWFINRSDDHRALGDWAVDTRKFPNGLGGLAKRIKEERGLKFGIWMEPEMISVDSNLYRQHPDWCLHIPGRAKTEGRNQLVLDLSRRDVQDFIVESVSRVLHESHADYLKWDFNRHLTEVGNELLPADQQGELLYRWVIGLYTVLYRIMRSFPSVLLESCSGGGGRFDLAFHYFSHQIWTSDNTDALERSRIQYGTLMAYPANTMSSHVSAVPNHQLHRVTSLWSRHVAAMSGTLGYELDLQRLPERERQMIKALVPYYKANIEPLILTGDLYRISSPFNDFEPSSNQPIVAAWGFVSADKREAVFYCILASFYQVIARPARLLLKGLDENKRYQMLRLVEAPDNDSGFRFINHENSLSGMTLMGVGVPLKFNHDIDAILIRLTAI